MKAFIPHTKSIVLKAGASRLSSLYAGVTLVEFLIVIGIISILVATAVISAFTFRANTELTTSTNNFMEDVRSVQSQTLASENDSSYGVHLEESRYTLFRGSDFASRNTAFDEVRVLPPRVEFASWSLGGGDDLVFDRVTGSTQNSGTVTLSLISAPSQTKTVNLSPSGKIFLSGIQPALSDTRITDTRHVHYTLGWSMESSTTMRLFFDSSPDVTEDIPIQSYISGSKFDWSGTVDVNGSNQVLHIHTHVLDSFDTILSVHRELDENDRPLDISVDSTLITSYDVLGNATPATGVTMEIQ